MWNAIFILPRSAREMAAVQDGYLQPWLHVRFHILRRACLELFIFLSTLK